MATSYPESFDPMMPADRLVTARGTVYAPPTALYTMTTITRKVLIFKNHNINFFQYSGTNWYSIGAKNMKIPSLIMIFHEFFHYIGLPPPKYRPKSSFMKIHYFSRKTHFWRFGFLTHLTDAYETDPGPSSGAEIKSPQVF